MTTPEQQALIDDLISHLGNATTHAEALIAERDALKAELAAIKQGAGEPAAWANLGDLISAKNGRERYGNQGAPDMHTWSEGGPSNYHDTPLYTRPATPLTDEKVKELICERFVTGENLFNEVHQDYRFRSRATERNVWGRDLLAFARDVEAHIKGAK